MLSAGFVRCGTGTLAWKIAPLQGGKSECRSRVVLLYDKLHGVVTESAMSIIEEDLHWWRESRHVSPLLYRADLPLRPFLRICQAESIIVVRIVKGWPVLVIRLTERAMLNFLSG
jgi:hypothetical protein